MSPDPRPPVSDQTPTPERRAIHVGDATLYRNAEAAWGTPDVLNLPSGAVVHLDAIDAEFLTPLFEDAQAFEARLHMVEEPAPTPKPQPGDERGHVAWTPGAGLSAEFSAPSPVSPEDGAAEALRQALAAAHVGDTLDKAPRVLALLADAGWTLRPSGAVS